MTAPRRHVTRRPYEVGRRRKQGVSTTQRTTDIGQAPRGARTLSPAARSGGVRRPTRSGRRGGEREIDMTRPSLGPSATATPISSSAATPAALPPLIAVSGGGATHSPTGASTTATAPTTSRGSRGRDSRVSRPVSPRAAPSGGASPTGVA